MFASFAVNFSILMTTVTNDRTAEKPLVPYLSLLTLGDFRGISISPVISKLFELAILERFSSLFELSDSQFRFELNLCCSHVI